MSNRESAEFELDSEGIVMQGLQPRAPAAVEASQAGKEQELPASLPAANGVESEQVGKAEPLDGEETKEDGVGVASVDEQVEEKHEGSDWVVVAESGQEPGLEQLDQKGEKKEEGQKLEKEKTPDSKPRAGGVKQVLKSGVFGGAYTILFSCRKSAS